MVQLSPTFLILASALSSGALQASDARPLLKRDAGVSPFMGNVVSSDAAAPAGQSALTGAGRHNVAFPVAKPLLSSSRPVAPAAAGAVSHVKPATKQNQTVNLVKAKRYVRASQLNADNSADSSSSSNAPSSYATTSEDDPMTDLNVVSAQRPSPPLHVKWLTLTVFSHPSRLLSRALTTPQPTIKSSRISLARPSLSVPLVP